MITTETIVNAIANKRKLNATWSIEKYNIRVDQQRLAIGSAMQALHEDRETTDYEGNMKGFCARNRIIYKTVLNYLKDGFETTNDNW